MNARVYNGEIDRLRSAERIARLEVERVVNTCIAGDKITSVLDVGTGSGVFAEEFNKRGLTVSAIEPNNEMIAAFKRYLPEINVRNATAENIPYEDNSFDILFMGLVLHEVDDYSKTINEAYRVTRKAVFILEWDYIEQELGPPLEHRLQSSFINKLSIDSGFTKMEIIKLTNMVLYKLLK